MCKALSPWARSTLRSNELHSFDESVVVEKTKVTDWKFPGSFFKAGRIL
jgi:hypothetical protein